LQFLRHPAADRTAAEPVILEERKLLQVVEALHLLQRVELQLLSLFEPKGATGGSVEMPPDRFHGVGIQFLFGLVDFGF